MRKRSAHQFHRAALLLGRDFHIPLRGRQLAMARQLHDGLDAHRVIGQGRDEPSPSGMAGRPLDPRIPVERVDQLAERIGREALTPPLALLACQHRS